MSLVTVSATNAETDAPLGDYTSPSGPLRFSVAVVAVKAQVSPDAATHAFASLATEPADSALAVAGPPDKELAGTPAFGAAFFAVLDASPRIYRVDGSLALPLVPSGETAGWYLGAVAPASDQFDIGPAWFWIPKSSPNKNAPFVAYAKDLTPLAREVLEMRTRAKVQLAILKEEWGTLESPGVWNQAHYFVENGSLYPVNPMLAAHWINDLSWAILDFSVPARDFDLIVERHAKMVPILWEIPWPDLPFFDRCANGLPLTISKDGQPLTALNWRLGAPSFSDYYPREDDQIKRDLGNVFLVNLGPLMACIVEHVQQKIEDAKKTAKFWHLASIIAPIFFFPSPAFVIGAIKELALETFLANAKPALQKLASLGADALISLAMGGVSLPATDGLTGKAWDVILAQFKTMLGSQGLAALKDAKNDTDKLSAALQAGTGLADIPPTLKPFIIWCLRVTVLDVLIAALANEASGGNGTASNLVLDPMLADAKANGVPVPGSVTKLANGEDPAFPLTAPSGFPTTAVAVGGGITLATVLGWLALSGKLGL